MDEPRGSTNTSSTENTKVANSIIHKTKVFGSVKLGRAAETCKFLEVSEVTTPASMTQAPVLPEQEFSARNETHAWLACTFSRVGKKKDGENIEPCEKCDPVNTGEARLSIKVAGEKMEDVLKHVTAVDTIVGELHSRIYRIPVSRGCYQLYRHRCRCLFADATLQQPRKNFCKCFKSS